MPGQSRSARQQKRYDVLVKAAQHAMRRLEGKVDGYDIAEARKRLREALREVGEHDR